MRFIKDITALEKEELERLLKESTSFRERHRAQALLLSSQGYRITQLTSIFDVDRDTVSAWLNRFELNRTTGLKDGKGRGRPKKVSDEVKKK